jgi:hypothetical protein
MKRDKQVNEFLHMTPLQIERNLVHMASQPVSREQREEQRSVTQKVLGDMLSIEGLGDQLTRKSILDSTGGGTSGGSVYIRQDLEAPALSLFVQNFPAYERIRKAQSNGLVHTL